jgi:hypothetical protein
VRQFQTLGRNCTEQRAAGAAADVGAGRSAGQHRRRLRHQRHRFLSSRHVTALLTQPTYAIPLARAAECACVRVSQLALIRNGREMRSVVQPAAAKPGYYTIGVMLAPNRDSVRHVYPANPIEVRRITHYMPINAVQSSISFVSLCDMLFVWGERAGGMLQYSLRVVFISLYCAERSKTAGAV